MEVLKTRKDYRWKTRTYMYAWGLETRTKSRFPRGLRAPKQFFVYIMTNGPKPAVLYVGVTDDLRRRVWQHKNKLIPGFTSRYNLTRLACTNAIFIPMLPLIVKRKSKAGGRSKKIRLIESMNPRCDDLAKRLGRHLQVLTRSRCAGDPSSRWRKHGDFGMTPFCQ
jgi:putative endonuclease